MNRTSSTRARRAASGASTVRVGRSSLWGIPEQPFRSAVRACDVPLAPMRRAVAALPVALALAACGPLIPLPPADRADVVEPADAGAADAPVIDAAVCTYPLRVGCTGPAGCAGFRECDFTETFLGPCTCYPDAGWDRPPAVDAPPADAPGVVDAAAPEDRPPPDVVTADDRPALADVADAGARDSGLAPSVCVAHMIGCSSNRECEACGATPEGVSFCCSTNTNVCLLRNVTRGCMR